MRGKGVWYLTIMLFAGITPAYAGKRKQLPLMNYGRQDHPRVCGEKQRTLAVQDEPQGSPPRMRGKVTLTAPALPCGGITPAYAGKRRCKAASVWLFRDHPRVCGEKFLGHVRHHRLTGSPPRMRGKAALRFLMLPHCGITPAYAGKRQSCKGNFEA